MIRRDGVNESAVIVLNYEYDELLISVCAEFMCINAYKLLGVESVKIILKNQLKG